MNSGLQRIDGARVEIKPKTVLLKTLQDYFNQRGQPIDVKPRTNKAALRESQAQYCKAHPDGFKVRVEALDQTRKSVASFEAISVVPGKDGNCYPQRFRATVIADRVFCTHPYVDSHDLQQLYDEFKQMAPVGSVRNAVVEYIEGYLSGVKAATDVYWLPEWSVDRWRTFAADLEELGCLESFTIVTNLEDSETVRWIGAKIKERIERIAEDVREGLSERNVKDTTLQKRRDKLAEEREQLKRFEQSLGVPLDACRDLLTDADEALVAKDAVVEEDQFADMWS